jgi:DNA repair photolyase
MRPIVKGRGAPSNPPNRFERLELSLDGDYLDALEATPRPKTQFFKDTTRTFISYNESPDIGYRASVNPYRGCEHGCSYCYARPTHEYLGFSAGLDFETRIMVKLDAPELLCGELSAPGWQPQVIGFSGVTDIYQPIERKLKLTRSCLEIFCEFRNPVAIVTKNALVTRDLDLLHELARYDCVSVAISITTLDERLRAVMEPRTSTMAHRLSAVHALAEAGIHVGVLMAPIIPGLNDHEIPALVEGAKEAGAKFVGYSVVHLPYGVKDLFVAWLRAHYPERADKVIHRIRAVRGGRLNDARFGYRMTGEGRYAAQLAQLFRVARARAGFTKSDFRLSTAHFRVPGRVVQPGLFDA